MDKSSLTFDVSSLMESGTGAKETFSFDSPVHYDDFISKSHATGRVEIMRIGEGFNVRVLGAEIKVEQQCGKCLKKFTENIRINSFDREFLFEMPMKVSDPNDLFIVDTRRQKIDLLEPLRQEIILHFPLIPVCSMGCKGVCPHCGKNRNTSKCDCKDEDSPENKALSVLKDLIK